MKVANLSQGGIPLAAIATTEIADHTCGTEDVHEASAIEFTPAGTISATNVQDAIEEVAAEAGSPADITDIPTAETDTTKRLAPDGVGGVEWAVGGGGAPDTVDYLVGTASGGLSAEIVVGTTPGGELGGTWASPTVDGTHSGSAHTDFIAKSVISAKGDIVVGSAAATPTVRSVGTNGYALVADSSHASGLAWLPVSGGGGGIGSADDSENQIVAVHVFRSHR